jgi:predicted Rossmann fold flavoprotein
MLYDTIIIGAGAAGIFTAIQASYLGANVLLLEKNNKPGLKILISGGGRCNFTNLYADPSDYSSENPHFCKSALARYSAEDFMTHYQTLGLGIDEKKKGQLFCAQGAKAFLNALLQQLEECDVPLYTSSEVQSVDADEQGGFVVRTQNDEYRAQNVVLANGGLSWPKLGANGSGYAIAKQFGHRITRTRPGLVPYLWSKDDQHFAEISGVATPASITIGEQTFVDDLLFTHHGLSGPVTLQSSNHWRFGESMTIDLLPNHDLGTLLDPQAPHREKLLRTVLEDHLPKRLVTQMLPKSMADLKIKQQQPSHLGQLEAIFKKWTLIPRDQAGFAKAEVTLGGVDTREISSKTMESQKQKGLYFVGEVMDVTGQLGGFNFQWAWSSGWSAAQNICPY